MEDVKKSLRLSLMAKRQALSASTVRELSAAIKKRILDFQPYVRANEIGLYSSIDNEVSTEGLFEHAIAAKKRVYFPRVYTINQSLQWLRVWDIKTLATGPSRIPEPCGKAITEWPERDETLIFVPGVGFDTTGHRIGRGKGHYDRFLSSFNRHGNLVGLAYEFQLLSWVPAEQGDQRVDYVITEKRIICVTARTEERDALVPFTD
jgi:5-formyltetrahydrofolate cyclo-ligase